MKLNLEGSVFNGALKYKLSKVWYPIYKECPEIYLCYEVQSPNTTNLASLKFFVGTIPTKYYPIYKEWSKIDSLPLLNFEYFTHPYLSLSMYFELSRFAPPPYVMIYPSIINSLTLFIVNAIVYF